MRLKGYENQKAVNSPWFSKIPDHWEWLEAKHTLRFKSENVGNYVDSLQLLSLTLNGVIPRVIDGKGKYPSDFNNYQKVQRDDLVFCLFDMDETPRTVGMANQTGMITNAYQAATALNSAYAKFIYYYFFFIDTHKGLKPYYTGLRKVVKPETFLRIKIPTPPFWEQQKIAQFLDYETAKIDALIDEQKRLIELLKEKRQAVISHAVTKGLNPDAAMKDSGVEWLGEVPEHWKIQKLSHLTSKIGSGKTPKGGALAYVDSGIKLIRSQNVYDDGLRLTDIAYITSEVDADMYWSRVQAHDILINITGGSIGRTCVISDAELPANVNQHVCIIRLDKQWKGYLDWTAFFLKSVLIKEQINFYQTGSGREGLNFEQLSNFRVPMPPLAEAKNISKHLADELSTIEQLNSRALLCSKLLKERRSALISAAVTGKIDVRDWQPPAGSDTVDSNASVQTERHYG